MTQLPMCAAFILFLDLFRTEENDAKKKTLPYLSIADGLYGKLAILGEGPYEGMLSLSAFAYRI